jgi:uncharacterized protein
MPAYTTSFLFPDINVWIALISGGHTHHEVASDWYNSLKPDARFCFCRFTQLGVLRLLTAEAVMKEDVLTQADAWRVYDKWIEHGAKWLEEPDLERRFRALTRTPRSSPKAWADAYLAAFAEASEVTLVTFDRAFHGKVKPLILLEE